MPYDEHPHIPTDRTDDLGLDARDLFDDLSALVDAGLVVPLQDADGEVRVIPADPLDFDADAEIDAYDQRS